MKFELDEKAMQSFAKWNEAHIKDRHGGKEPYAGAIGGRITFSFGDTSLGRVSSVKCELCGEEHSLTDWENFG
jgi:hypothetical protein